MCYIVFIPRIQRPLRPASVFSMMMMIDIFWANQQCYMTIENVLLERRDKIIKLYRVFCKSIYIFTSV